MLSLQDCIDFSELSAEEIAVIAEHEEVPDIVAAEIAATLMQSVSGICLIKLYFQEALEQARAAGHFDRARNIETLYLRFHRAHPGADPA